MRKKVKLPVSIWNFALRLSKPGGQMIISVKIDDYYLNNILKMLEEELSYLLVWTPG